MASSEIEKIETKYTNIIAERLNKIDLNDESEKHFFFEDVQYYFRHYLVELEQIGEFNKTYEDKKLKTEAHNFLKEQNEENVEIVSFTIEIENQGYFIRAKLAESLKNYYLQIKRGNLKPLFKNLTITKLQIYKDNQKLYELGEETGFPSRRNFKT